MRLSVRPKKRKKPYISLIHKVFALYFCLFLKASRAENGIRTRDPQLGKLMLYRLSYFRITEYKVTPFFLFVKFSAPENSA
jgi:hypothetical protein